MHNNKWTEDYTRVADLIHDEEAGKRGGSYNEGVPKCSLLRRSRVPRGSACINSVELYREYFDLM